MCTKRSLKNAFTVVELSIATAIASMLMVAVGSFTVYSGRTMAALFNYVDLDYASRLALDGMTREIRQTAYRVGASG